MHTRVQTTCAEVKRDNIICHMHFLQIAVIDLKINMTPRSVRTVDSVVIVI